MKDDTSSQGDDPVGQSQQAHEAVQEALGGAETPAEVDMHEDRVRTFKTPGFSRMRTDWQGPDADHVRYLKTVVDGRILALYADAWAVMNDVYDLVREPVVNKATGEIEVDRFGFKVWQRSISGAYVEDFSRLTNRERDDLLFRITTRLFEWKQTAADLWGEAMFAKAQWEEALAIGFDEPKGRLTVDDRTQKGRLFSRDERYFAIFQSLMSRKADAVVSSLELLGQRLKDSLTAY